jgi:hypothetical protein
MNSQPTLLEGLFYLGFSFLASFSYYLLLKVLEEEIRIWSYGFILLLLPLPGMLNFLSSTSLSSDVKKGVFVFFVIIYSVLCKYISAKFKSNQITLNPKLMTVVILSWIFVAIFYFLRVK